jgi:polyferredoxin
VVALQHFAPPCRHSFDASQAAGLFVNWRWALVWLTQIVFYGLPWLMWNDRQAVLFDLVNAALLHLRPGAVPAGLHLPHRRCW